MTNLTSWTNTEFLAATAAIADHDAMDGAAKAASSALAVEYKSHWEIFVRGDYNPPEGDYIQKINLSGLRGCLPLIQTCLNLENTAPCCVFENDGPDGHWSGTIDLMTESLGRDLTDLEITALSLSRYFGPTPAINEHVAREIFVSIWPEGNPCGYWLDWYQLAERLSN